MPLRFSRSSSASTTARAGTPPVDWFVTLMADQVQSALAEANSSFEGLTRDVLALAQQSGSDSGAAAGRDATLNALIRLQAIDRLQQRLGGVDRNLRELASLLGETDHCPSWSDWQSFLEAVRARYPTDAERTEFDAAVGTSGSRPRADDN